MATHSVSDANESAEGFSVDGNRLVPIAEGAARMAALIDLIDGARHELRLLYYIFAPDACGTRVRDAAIAARARGVEVSVLVDGFGSEQAGPDFFAPLVDAGARFCRFLPRYGRRYLLRNHQKMAIADDDRVLIGGFNVEADYFAPGETGWRDFGLVVEGPAAVPLIAYFDALSDWVRTPRAKMRTVTRLIARSSQTDGAVRWLFGGPTKRLSPWARAIKRDMQTGRRLDMIAGYFTPSLGILRRIRRLAHEGDQVRIVTAAKSDNSMTIAAARHTYARLLRRGVRVFEYQPSRLHTKLYVVDDVVYIGSANFDIRSLFLNLEVMLRIKDAGFAAAIRRHVDGEVADCREVKPDLLRARAGTWTRLRWSVAYFLVAVVDYTVTRRLNFRPGGEGIAT